jgi:peptidoglycan hydrolase-like protein with peptidoglycan-binding domain
MLLKVGSKGNDVVKLQTKLGIANDGSFGPGTERAVKAWQQANGLPADGIVGDSTWAKLYGEAAAAFLIPESDFNLDALKGHVPDGVIAQIPGAAAKFGISNTSASDTFALLNIYSAEDLNGSPINLNNLASADRA